MYYEDMELLHHLILPSNMSNAVFYLERLDGLVELHKIYQHFFPEDYALDNCQWMITDDSISSWELNLFRLIDENLFSLPESLVLGEESFTLIPAWPFYPDWWDTELESLPKSFQLVLCISSHVGMGFFGEIPNWISEAIPDLEAVQGCDFLKLEALCKQSQTPLIVLPKIMEILDHCTGNVWLDSTNEAYLEFDWTIDNVKMLRANWLDCQFIYSQVAELDDWLEDKKNIAAFCQILYECDDEPHDAPQPLMEVLADLL
ncbi:hypothetical protein [Nostoc sp. DedQUE07]|uniref:hypothetical protein n=1 Tax=Nostoc sp. DedQUE07 TaxID=3075392 RepID=UPI002AD25F16|nr:hypothetical protein [Nostoc sp. DedQUE07]